MTIQGNEIKVNDDVQITNTREAKMHEQALFKKNFIFKGYKTEKDRIVTNQSHLYHFLGRHNQKQHFPS